LLKKPLRRGASGVHLLGFCCRFSCARPARLSCFIAHRPCTWLQSGLRSRCCRGSGLASSGEQLCADKQRFRSPGAIRARSSPAAPQKPLSRQRRDDGVLKEPRLGRRTHSPGSACPWFVWLFLRLGYLRQITGKLGSTVSD
jgi:hypothetical protein